MTSPASRPARDGPWATRGPSAAPALAAAILVSVLGSATRAAPAPGTRPNLLLNGGFEQGLASWRPDPRHALTEDPKQVHAGKACLFGEVTKPSDALQLKTTVKVAARNLYDFEVWARGTNQTKLVLWAVKPGATERTLVTAWEKVTPSWQRYTTPLSVAQDGDLELHVIAPSSHAAPAGKIWIDDLALYETVLPAVTSVTGDQGFNDEPAAALAGDGSLYVAWVSFRNGADSLRAARYQFSAAGQPARSAEWETVGGPRTFVLHPGVVAAGDRAILLYAAENAAADWDIFAVTLGPDGPSRPAAVARAPGVDVKPAAVWRDGTLWLAWESNRGGQRGVWFTTWRDGQAGPAERVSAEGSSSYAPSLAVLESGEVCVAWHSFRSHNYDIYLRRRSSAGVWQAEARLTKAPGVDRHVRLFPRGNELWLVYESAQCKGYHIGANPSRRLVLARLGDDGQLLAPPATPVSPLAERCEAAAAAADSAGRIWLAHLRPRLPRAGWDTFLTGFTGTEWLPLQRISAETGMDRQPCLALAGTRAVVVAQVQPPFRQFQSVEQSNAEQSNIILTALDLSQAPPVAAMPLAPLSEPADEFEAAQLRQDRGDATPAPASIDYNGTKLMLVYGELHEHSEISQCNRLGDQSLDESYQHMRDITSLDFAAVTDHGYNLTPYLWNYTAKLARVNDDPGRFLTFLAEEWTSSFEIDRQESLAKLKAVFPDLSVDALKQKYPYGFFGHRNLVFADAYLPRWWNAQTGQTPADVWKELRAAKADFVHIPHQLADTGNVPTDWSFADETAQPVAEIFQTRGSYEYKGAPREAARSTPAGWFLQDAWARGIVIGVIASPDHGGGTGKACVFTPELSRNAVLAAFRARHCFGTTAARIFLDVRVNGHLMGEKLPTTDGKPVTVDVRARCPADIERIEVCRNNEFIFAKQPPGREAEFQFVDTKPLAGPSYYYVRLIQKDQEIAWSSPVWLGRP